MKTETNDSHLLYLLRGFLFIGVSLSKMASANVQVVPTAQPMYMPVFWMVAHIMMKAGLVMVDMMEAAKLVMSLNIVMVALSHSLLEVMAMPDSKSYNILFKTLLSTFEEKV